MKKVLVITYYWPPSGGSGVQRWLKFVKYFRDFGIEPIILTVDPSYATFPFTDESLLKDIPSDIEIHLTKAKSPFGLYSKIKGKKVPQSGFSGESKPGVSDKIIRFIRGNFFIPDARIGWNKFAIEKAKELILKYNLDTVITTSPPHSTQLIGLKLKEIFDVNWIADLRDPWTELYYNKELYRTKWAKNKDNRLEQKCLLNANEIIVVSQSISDLLTRKHQSISSKISVIPNGYDNSDFENINHTKSNNKYISYVGNLGPTYPIDSFLIEFKSFVLNHSEWKLRFIGNVYQEVKERVIQLGLVNFVEYIPYVEHPKAIEYMVNSDALLLIIPNTEDNKGILTGKLFEYMASNKPIVYIGPENGDAVRILEKCSNALTNNYSNMKSLENFLGKIHIKLERGETFEKYSRKNLTNQIASLIKKKI